MINTVLGVKSSDVNTGILIGAAISVPLYPLIGLLSQKIGRRPTIAVIGLLNLMPASALYYVLVAGAYRDSASSRRSPELSLSEIRDRSCDWQCRSWVSLRSTQATILAHKA